MPFLPSRFERACRICGTLLLAFWTLPGCSTGPGDEPTLGLVVGVVTLDDQPLAGAVVQFIPQTGRPSQGVTDDQGRYELDYTNSAKGAVIGRHTVRISTQRYVEEPDGSSKEMPETISAEYNTETILTASVQPGPNDIPFALTKD